MTQQSNSNNVPKIAYFNAHTEGLGYLDSLVEVKPKAGQDFAAFWTATFCMLEGDPKSPDKLYVSLTVPGAEVIELLTPYLSDINDQAIKVFVGLRLAKFRGVPFTFGPASKTPGELGVNYSARLIKVMCLKVGDTVIKLNSENDQASKFKSVPAASNNSQARQDDSGLFDMPLIVKLSKNDANFATEKTRISTLGYRWHAEMVAWVLPEVSARHSLSMDELKQADQWKLLESSGYVFDKDDLVFRMTFPKSRSNNGYSKSNQQSANNH